MKRRHFLLKSATGLAGAWALANLPQSLLAQSPDFLNSIPIGFQTWPVREKLATDFPGTLKMMAGLGYKQMELCSPKGFEKIGFGPLLAIKPADMRQQILDSGLTCPSAHFVAAEFDDDKIDASIEFAKGLGLSHMICSSFWLPKTATLDDYLKSADKLNKAGAKIKNAGMIAGFHNHAFEFEKLEGQLIYDALMKRFDPELVKMQFQTEVITMGFKGPDLFKKYPGRFISTHLSDWNTDKQYVNIGKGMIDWKEFFAAAEKAGVKTYYVEMDEDKFAESAKYIGGL